MALHIRSPLWVTCSPQSASQAQGLLPQGPTVQDLRVYVLPGPNRKADSTATHPANETSHEFHEKVGTLGTASCLKFPTQKTPVTVFIVSDRPACAYAMNFSHGFSTVDRIMFLRLHIWHSSLFNAPYRAQVQTISLERYESN